MSFLQSQLLPSVRRCSQCCSASERNDQNVHGTEPFQIRLDDGRYSVRGKLGTYLGRARLDDSLGFNGGR